MAVKLRFSVLFWLQNACRLLIGSVSVAADSKRRKKALKWLGDHTGVRIELREMATPVGESQANYNHPFK